MREQQKQQSGQALVEFSLILPILLFVILGIVDYGRVLFVFSNATSSLRAASRNAALAGDASNPNAYANCDNILSTASDIRFAAILDVEVYYYSVDQYFGAGAPVFDYDDWDFTCTGTVDTNTGDGNEPIVTPSDVGNDDIMRVELLARVDFITPFLSNIYSSIELDFVAQRTIVATIQLPGDSAQCIEGPNPNIPGYIPDTKEQDDTTEAYYYMADPNGGTNLGDADFDNLCDYWELMWFGCVATDAAVLSGAIDGTANGQPYIAPLDPGNKNVTVSYPAGTECEFFDDDPSLGAGNTPQWPVPATSIYSSSDDPDADGCNNGSEESRDLNPIFVGIGLPGDTDGDGLKDCEEIFDYFTDPLLFDTDGDGLGDGDEVFPSHSYGATNPLPTEPNACLPATIFGEDSDCDGLLDGEECPYDSSGNVVCISNPNSANSDSDSISDIDELRPELNPSAPGYNRTLVINGTTFTGQNIVTDPLKEDTDGDGLRDDCELDETLDLCNLQNRTTYVVTKITNPNNPDTDGDGLDDGVERNLNVYKVGSEGTVAGFNDIPGNNIYGDNASREAVENQRVNVALHQFDPSERDTDGDNVRDDREAQEMANPNAANSDFVAEGTRTEEGITFDCALTDFQELNSLNTNPSNVNQEDYIYTGTGTAPAGTTSGTPGTWAAALADPLPYRIDGYDSDGDSLSDCYEVLIFGSDPTNSNSDGDTTPARSDDEDPFPNDPTDGGFALDDTEDNGPGNPPGDGLIDAWELTYFSSINDYGPQDDPDNDGFSNFQEQANLTNPSPDDLTTCNYTTGAITPGPDGIPDGPDSDCDTILDGEEFRFGLGMKPTLWDTDNDGLRDDCEIFPDDTWRTDAQVILYYPGVHNFNFTRTGGAQGGVINESSGGFCTSTYNPTIPNVGDTDGDGLTDGAEISGSANILYPNQSTDPNNIDSDDDGVSDFAEVNATSNETFNEVYAFNTTFNYPGSNPNAANSDGDGWTDAQEWFTYTSDPRNADSDFDGLNDDLEFGASTEWRAFDTATCDNDLDGIPDGFSTTGGIDNQYDGFDSDCDGASDSYEYYGTDGQTVTYTRPDASTFQETRTINSQLEGVNTTFFVIGYNADVVNSMQPNLNDSDGDGLLDGVEIYGTLNVNFGNLPTSPINPDTDSDSSFGPDFNDGAEIANGTDPLSSDFPIGVDSDGDGILNEYEIYPTDPSNPNPHNYGPTNPGNVDTDGDGVSDGVEPNPGLDYTGRQYTDTTGALVNIITPVETNPNDGDTDGDGLPDGGEFNGTYDAANFPPEDYPGIDTLGAAQLQTDASTFDTDGDGIGDGDETRYYNAQQDTGGASQNSPLPLNGQIDQDRINAVTGSDQSLTDTTYVDDILYILWDRTDADNDQWDGSYTSSEQAALDYWKSFGGDVRVADDFIRILITEVPGEDIREAGADILADTNVVEIIVEEGQIDPTSNIMLGANQRIIYIDIEYLAEIIWDIRVESVAIRFKNLAIAP